MSKSKDGFKPPYRNIPRSDDRTRLCYLNSTNPGRAPGVYEWADLIGHRNKIKVAK